MLSKVLRFQVRLFYTQNKNATPIDGFKPTSQFKQTRKDFMHREMKENPEFFKAFPHLQSPLYATKNPEAEVNEYMDDANSSTLFNKQELKSNSSRDGYFESLLHQHNKYMTPEQEKEEMLRENELNFVDGY